ncbi:RDD family protein [Nocardioides sp. 503]|uniref:RDD family protein n=1 Tax=Nocardioides sp. 503 TaxID=2508326 RepID=UPI0010704C10|nr:RDD family protein [Nocardioides sp. 503]
MSNYGPAGDNPPPETPSGGGETPPPPPPPAEGYAAPPPPPAGGYGAPPPAPGYGAPPQPGGYGAPPPGVGVPRPGELIDRFLARLIDGLLIGVVYGILFTVLGAILIVDASVNFQTGEVDDGSSLLFYIVWGIVSAALGLGYFAFMESSRGATVGKQVLKLRVYGPDGVSNPTMEQAIRRNIFNAFPIAYVVPVVGPAIGGLAALVGEILIAVGINGDPVKRQGWHDKFAGGTTVMKVG